MSVELSYWSARMGQRAGMSPDAASFILGETAQLLRTCYERRAPNVLRFGKWDA